MKAYSVDLRERIVRAIANGTPQAVVATTFGVGRATVQRYFYRQRDDGSLTPRPIPGRPVRIGPAQEALLRAQLDASPEATLAEHCIQWEREHGVRFSVAAMHRTIARLGWTRKKRAFGRPSKTP